MATWMIVWMSVAVVVVVSGQASVTTGNHERIRREACDNDATFTIENAIRLIKLIENNNTRWDFEDTTNAIREQAYGDVEFDLLCGTDGNDDIPGISESELSQVQYMVKHSSEDFGREIGVVRTKEGMTIAFGHVLTGICAGINRDFTSFAFFNLDNVHAMTLAGDLGQTCAFDECRIGPAGQWNDDDCPMKYNISGRETEATNAEILGDIHGFLLGVLVHQINPQKLSKYLADFYTGPGIGRNGKFNAIRSIALFKELVSSQRLYVETKVFNVAYTKPKWNVDESSDGEIESVVRKFFQLEFMKSCIDDFPDTNKIAYFIDLITELERQSGNSLDKMVNDLKVLYVGASMFSSDVEKKGDGFEWYIASEVMHGKVDRETHQEYGVFEDSNGETLNIRLVIWGIYHGGQQVYSRRQLVTDWALYYKKNKQLVGAPGKWDESCPKTYSVPSVTPMTRAEFIGIMDSLVLAHAMNKYQTDNPSAKLSQLLSEYYATGLTGQPEIRSSKRFEHVARLLRDADANRHKRQTSASAPSVSPECHGSLHEDLKLACEEAADDQDTGLNEGECDSLTLKLCVEMTQAVAKALQVTVECKYGDITKLKPKGASTRTGGHYGAGVKASGQLIEGHMTRVEKYKDCFIQAGKAAGIQPALVAALASRESHVYSTVLLNADGTSKAANNAGYGMMQCDPKANIDCKKYGADSCEHVQQLIEEVLVKNVAGVRRKKPNWTVEQQLQGAVAAYNFGVDDVQTWSGLDVGSTGDDYSGDVVARAQYLICAKGWAYCGEICEPSTGSIPAQGTLQRAYPSPQQLPDAELRTRVARQAVPMDALRISYMFNQIPGHKLDHRETGSHIGENGMVYYEEARKLRLYLNDRYGYAASAQSVNAFNGKPGILFVKQAGSNNGVMGLWDGNKVLQMADFTGGGSTYYLWVTEKDCRLLAESGDCEFYPQCLENRLQCEPDGYPISYGYKFCTKFSQFYNDFTDEGKKWVDDVRMCLMKALHPVMANPGLTCSKLNEIAFKSHVPCYVDNGFCDVMVTPSNWDALFYVFTSDLSPFIGPNWDLAIGQIVGALRRCLGITATENYINDKSDAVIEWVQDLFSDTTQQEEEDAECVAYGTAGDCEFYECFEQRFQCKKQNGFSYLLQFELPSCLEFKLKASGFKASGSAWLTNYHKCLMSHLIPLYRSASVNCAVMGYTLKMHRASCIVEAGFCGMIKQNEFIIDRATDNYGYPQIQRRRSFTYPLSKAPDVAENFYYRELDQLKRDIGYARQTCTGALASDPALYSTVYSPITGMRMKLKNTKLGF